MKDNKYFSRILPMPAQAIHSSQKTEEWAKETIDSIDSQRQSFSSSSSNSLNSYHNKLTNFNLAKGIFDPNDFKYVTDPLNLGIDPSNQPSQLRNINLIGSKVLNLKGDELQNPFDFTAIGVAGEIINVIEEKRKEIIALNTATLIRKQLGLEPTQDEQGRTIPPEDPARVIENQLKSYKDIREINANKLLKVFWHELDLKEKFNEGFEYALTGQEEVYYVGNIGGKPGVRTVNIMNFDFDRSPTLKRIEDSDWAAEERYLSVGQIIDEYGEYLSDKDIKRLESGEIGNSYDSQEFFPGFVYNEVKLQTKITVKGGSISRDESSYIRTLDTAWKSRKKIGFLIGVSPQGEVEETLVDDTFKLTPELKEQGFTLEWRWINVVYKGTKIGDIYVDIGELPYQIRSQDNLSECKLPYVGKVYSNCFVELMKPHQYLYNIIWYRLETELAKAKGKAVIMDLAQMPRSEGIDVTEWMYYLDTAGVMFINSFEEGEEGVNTGKTASFNQFKEIDRAASQVIGQYLLILRKIEELFDSITGLNKQTQGQISPSETATGVERAVAQSNTITAPYFFTHDLVKQQVLTQLIEVAKIIYADGKKGRFFVDESFTELLRVDGPTFADTDYGVFITNGAAEKRKLATVEQAAMAALQASTIKLKEYVNVINSPSFAEKLTLLEKGELEQEERMARMEQLKGQQNMQLEQERTKREIQKQDREDARAQLSSNTQVAVAQIRALGFSPDKDVNNDNIPDVLQVEKISLDKQKLDLEKTKENNRVNFEKDKLKLEEKKINTQLQIAKENKNKHDIKK